MATPTWPRMGRTRDTDRRSSCVATDAHAKTCEIIRSRDLGLVMITCASVALTEAAEGGQRPCYRLSSPSRSARTPECLFFSFRFVRVFIVSLAPPVLLASALPRMKICVLKYALLFSTEPRASVSDLPAIPERPKAKTRIRLCVFSFPPGYCLCKNIFFQARATFLLYSANGCH